MTSQHLTLSPSPQLDDYFNGIRIEFDRLNQELEEARKQRDAYKTNYMNQEKELREFITTLLHRLNRKDQICKHCTGDTAHTVHSAGLADDNASTSPPSPSSEYHSPLNSEGKGIVPSQLDSTEISMEIRPVEEEQNHDDDVRDGAISTENEDLTISGITSPSLQSNTNEVGKSGWDIMYNGETEVALKLDLVHEFTQWCTRTAFSPDGKYIAVISDDVARIFDVNTGERISQMRDIYNDPGEGVSNTCLDFSPDNKYLATGDAGGKVRIWIISQRRVRNMFSLRDYIDDLHFSPNGQHLVTVSSDSTVRIWRLRDGSSTVLTGGEHLPWAVRFSPNGKYLASGYSLGQILIWNVRTRRLVARWEGHSDRVSSLVFTPDGNGLLTGSLDKTVVFWDVAWLSSSGDNAEGEQDVNPIVTEISRIARHEVDVYRISISPDGQWIASSSYDDNTVRIWNTRDATLQCTLRGPGEVWSAVFNPIRTYLAIGGNFPQVTIWNYSCTAVSPLQNYSFTFECIL